MFAHRAQRVPATFIRLWIEANKSGQALRVPFGRALPTGQGLPLQELNEQGQHSFRADAGQGEQTLLILGKRFMAVAKRINGSLNLGQGVGQGVNDLLQTPVDVSTRNLASPVDEQQQGPEGDPDSSGLVTRYSSLVAPNKLSLSAQR
jgi:hypothetical protein